MKKLLCAFFALLLVVLLVGACAPVISSDTSTDTETGGGTNSDTNDNVSSDTSTDTGENKPSDTDTDENKPSDTDTDENKPSDTDTDENKPSDTDTDENEKPKDVENSVSKTATEMATSIGKGGNGDIVSGAEIKLDDNISVSFGKGTANTEPALYSEAIRIYQNGGTLTVKAKNGTTLKTVIITFDDSKSGNNKLTVSGGSKPSVNGDTITVNANSGVSEITITVSGTSKSDRLYVSEIEVIYVGQGTPSEPSKPDTGDGDENGGDRSHLYTDFTASEKSTYNEYVGFVIPFFKNNEYYIESYDEDGYRGVYFSAICQSKSDFDSYLTAFSSYVSDGTDVDEYGDTWYLYSKNGVYVDVCYYEYEGAYYVDVDAYSESNGGNGGGGNGGGGNGDSGSDDDGDGSEGSYLYYEFTASEKSTYNEYVGFVIPFLSNNEYTVEGYDEDGYRGVYYSALCESETSFTWYLAMFSSYGSDGTDVDEYGDTWYLYSKNGVYVDVCYYEYEGAYYVDVDAWLESSGGDSGDGDSGNGDNSGNGGNEDDENVITNAGASLPNDNGSGIYDVNFKDADKVKDVTDQGYYLDGCPTTGAPAVLVIPVDFSDRSASLLGYDIDKIKNVFYENGENDYYSVYDYYYISSMGQLTLDITVVDSWFRPSNPSTYYAKRTMNYDGESVFIGDQLIMDEALAYLAKTMDLSKFDSDSNGRIDSVVLVTSLEIDPDTDFYWAYRYWNIYTDSNDYYYEYDGVSANDYVWASYSFIYDDMNDGYSDTSISNPYTFIHEFGHILGVEDYYDTAYASSPLDGYDIMDSMIADHNAYTKFNLGWITSSRLVVTDTSVTVTLEAFSQSGDTLILANNWDPTLGVYQEYYILVYYTESELNSGMGGLFDEAGIVVYHVNASLFFEEYEGEIYYDVYNNNTDPSDDYGTKNNLLELVKGNDDYVYQAGESMPTVYDDYGTPLSYTFTVTSVQDGAATLTVSVR